MASLAVVADRHTLEIVIGCTVALVAVDCSSQMEAVRRQSEVDRKRIADRLRVHICCSQRQPARLKLGRPYLQKEA